MKKLDVGDVRIVIHSHATMTIDKSIHTFRGLLRRMKMLEEEIY
jgi:hypothetical protein